MTTELKTISDEDRSLIEKIFPEDKNIIKAIESAWHTEVDRKTTWRKPSLQRTSYLEWKSEMFALANSIIYLYYNYDIKIDLDFDILGLGAYSDMVKNLIGSKKQAESYFKISNDDFKKVFESGSLEKFSMDKYIADGMIFTNQNSVFDIKNVGNIHTDENKSETIKMSILLKQIVDTEESFKNAIKNVIYGILGKSDYPLYAPVVMNFTFDNAIAPFTFLVSGQKRLSIAYMLGIIPQVYRINFKKDDIEVIEK